MLKPGHRLPLATIYNEDRSPKDVVHWELCTSPASLALAPWDPVPTGLTPHTSHVPAQPALESVALST